MSRAAPFTKEGSIVTPSPGPVGTVSIPLTLASDDVLDETGGEASRPLYSWNGPAFGTHDAKCATYK